MRLLLLCLCAALLSTCASTGGRARTRPDPAALQVEFDSRTAAAHLRWRQAMGTDFLAYELQRASAQEVAGASQEFTSLARIETLAETTYVDSGLYADTAYRYRLLTRLGREDLPARVRLSSEIEGGIHRFVNSWKLPAGFLPVRLAVDERGAVSVVGAGAGSVARFDRAGHPLGNWTFATDSLACLETGTLDAPALALDRHGNLYILYNQRDQGRAPRAFWTKFDRQGRRIWTRPLEGIFARHIAIDPQDQIFIESLGLLHQFTADGQSQAQYPLPALRVSSLRFWKDYFAVLVQPFSFAEQAWQAPRLAAYSGPDRAETVMVIGRDPLSPEDRGDGLLQRPSDFAVDEVGSRAFVVNAGHQRIEVFRHSRFLTSWGREGEAEGEFRFSGPLKVIDDLAAGTTVQRQVVAGGIARDPEGFLYVADTFNNRIQKFNP